MLRVKAKFKGVDLSLGYEPGKEYLLRLVVRYDNSISISKEAVKAPDNGFAIYASLSDFLSSWEGVTKV